MEERYIRYALSMRWLLELDQLMGKATLKGLEQDITLTASETQELAQFLIEHRNIIDEISREAEKI